MITIDKNNFRGVWNQGFMLGIIRLPIYEL